MTTIHCPFCGSDKTSMAVGSFAGEVDGTRCDKCDKVYPIAPWDFNKRPVEYQLAKMAWERLFSAPAASNFIDDIGYMKTDRFGNLAAWPEPANVALADAGLAYDYKPCKSIADQEVFNYLRSKGFLVQHEDDKSLWRLKDAENNPRTHNQQGDG